MSLTLGIELIVCYLADPYCIAGREPSKLKEVHISREVDMKFFMPTQCSMLAMEAIADWHTNNPGYRTVKFRCHEDHAVDSANT